MNERINLNETEPAALKAMLTLEKYVTETPVSAIHKELIRIRVSQLNGCSFCLDMHIKEAKKIGEDEQRLHMLAVWRVSDLFSGEEKVILALTERMTLIHQERIPAKLLTKAKELFGEKYLAQLIMTIVTINAWNRIAITTDL
ncbi:carboxymuconolactone decarboxylase family protein [Lacibacter sp. MH-610]|uniref:carboxymuconolactone decarboxylase family protein n=1 Tax=Lacibacter sp. MH-610 TaxID=3020883 RepID=UPI0038925361